MKESVAGHAVVRPKLGIVAGRQAGWMAGTEGPNDLIPLNSFYADRTRPSRNVAKSFRRDLIGIHSSPLSVEDSLMKEMIAGTDGLGLRPACVEPWNSLPGASRVQGCAVRSVDTHTESAGDR